MGRMINSEVKEHSALRKRCKQRLKNKSKELRENNSTCKPEKELDDMAAGDQFSSSTLRKVKGALEVSA